MNSYWITFKTHRTGCVEAQSKDDAKRLAQEITGHEPVMCDILPYPADPRLNVVKHKMSDGEEFTIPSFCYTPEQCCGRTCCPKRRACDD